MLLYFPVLPDTGPSHWKYCSSTKAVTRGQILSSCQSTWLLTGSTSWSPIYLDFSFSMRSQNYISFENSIWSHFQHLKAQLTNSSRWTNSGATSLNSLWLCGFSRNLRKCHYRTTLDFWVWLWGRNSSLKPLVVRNWHHPNGSVSFEAIWSWQLFLFFLC